MNGQESYRPTMDEVIESRFGKETMEKVARNTKTIFECIKAGLGDIAFGEGDTSQQKEKGKKYLKMWNDFAEGIFLMQNDMNRKSPKMIETVLKGATSLMVVESTDANRDSANANRDSAKEMAEALNKRYH